MTVDRSQESNREKRDVSLRSSLSDHNVAITLGLVLCSAAVPSQGQTPPQAFYVMNADGTGWRKLFQLKDYAASGSPAVSPDGQMSASEP